MKTLHAIIQILLFYPICVFVFQMVIMKLGTVMAFQKAWNALLLELMYIYKIVNKIYEKIQMIPKNEKTL